MNATPHLRIFCRLAFTLLLLAPLAVHAQTNYPSGTVFTIAGGGTNYPGDGGYATNASINPYGSAIGPDGSIYFADNFNSRIRCIAPNGIITTVAGDGSYGDTGDGGQATNAKISGVLNIAVDGARSVLYIGDIDNNRVRQVNLTNGIISNFAGSGTFGFSGDGGAATSARFRSPQGVAVDREGNVYIGDVLNNRIRKVTITNGIINTYAGNGTSTPSGDGGPATSAGIRFPGSIAVDDFSNVFVIDGLLGGGGYRVRRIDASTRIITPVAGGGTNTPTSGPATSMLLDNVNDIAVNRAGTELFINGYSQVPKVNLATGQMSIFAGTTNSGFSGDGGPALNAQFELLGGIVLTPAGEVIVSDSNYGRLRYIVPDSVQLACNNTLTELRLPFVNFLSGDLTIENNSSVTNVDAGGVSSAGGDVKVVGNTNAKTIDLGSFTSINGSLTVSGNTDASTIDLSSFTSVNGNATVTGNTDASTIDLSSFTSINGNATISGNTSASTIDCSSLTAVNGNTTVTGNTDASTIDLSSFTSTSGNTTVSHNTSASTIDLSSFTSTGGLTISDNASVTNITLPALTNVSSTGSSLVQSAHLFASSPSASDHFGAAVAVSNNVLVATAPEADLPGMADAGAAFLYTNNAGTWSAPVQLTAGGFAGTDFRFGQCVALDGDTLMIGAADRLGAPGETWGAVYVFTRSGSTWPTTPTQQLLSPQASSPVNDNFGNAVSVSGDLAAIGEYLDSANLGDTNAVGAVHIFRKSGGTWSAVQTILPPRPKLLGRFGASVALQGTNLLIGEPGADVTVCKTDAGAVWVYELDGSGTNFIPKTVLTATDSEMSDQFGWSVALDGTNAVIGAVTADLGNATDAGAAYVFKRTAGVWREQSKLAASEPQTNGQFGASVALRGNRAVVGATETPAGAGSGHAFTCDLNGNWTYRRRRPTDQAVGDDFGGAVAFDGENVAWGARLDNTAGGVDAGSVYVDSMSNTNAPGGDITVSGNTNATAIDFGSLESAGGDVDVSGNTNATAIDFGSLGSAGGDVDVNGNTNATAIDFGSLESVDGDLNVDGNTNATAIDFGALDSVDGDVDVNGNTNATAIDFGSLESADGDVDVDGNTNATAIDFGSLDNTGGDVNVSGNTNARAIDFGSLASSGGDVNVSGNSSATNINTGSLTSVGGDLTIADNGTNTMVNLNGLTCFGDGTNAQTLTLDGGTVSITNGLCIASNALFTGSTTLEGSVTNSGVLAPGSSPGRMDLTGNLALNASSELRLQVAGYALAQYDFVGVSGAVTLGGELSVELLNGFESALTNGASFTVLTAGSPISGAFANVASGGTLTTPDGYARFTVLYAGDTSLRLANVVMVDDDNDGLPNWWEDKFGLNKNDIADGALDADSDGMSSLREFQSGTNPTNAASVFRILSAVRTNNDFQVNWTTVGGYRYVVQTVTNASGEWTTNFLDVSGVFSPAGTNEGTTNYMHLGGATNPAGFYRVRVEP